MDEKVALCMSFAQECIEEAELRSLFTSNKPSIVAYDGFEPSGRMHIAQVWTHILQRCKVCLSRAESMVYSVPLCCYLNAPLGTREAP